MGDLPIFVQNGILGLLAFALYLFYQLSLREKIEARKNGGNGSVGIANGRTPAVVPPLTDAQKAAIHNTARWAEDTVRILSAVDDEKRPLIYGFGVQAELKAIRQSHDALTTALRITNEHLASIAENSKSTARRLAALSEKQDETQRVVKEAVSGA